ncbi:hypothetical protein KPH14_002455 [Odynerus spinipes]|uniref:Uncharacterized protein n=1 Tax=Odynerus spinipes TaxID=1348599 RepID=A0AAD9VM85_9HYME|nr:hypothetical protein KPH14_002455 [Odynerus spinipes]
MNTIVSAVFTKLAIDEPLKRFKYTSRVQQAVNGTYQRSIKSTPFELLFGLKMRHANDPKFLELINDEVQAVFTDAREEARRKAKEEIAKVQAENVRDYNRRRKKATKYQMGDLVAIKRTQLGGGLKMRIKFLGPYRVSRIMGKDRYEVENMGGEGPLTTSCSADHMKPWKGFNQNQGQVEVESSGADE